MHTFKLTADPDWVVRDDGLRCQVELSNYQDFLASGGVPLPADPPSPTEIIAALTAALERHYDLTASTRRYDNRYTCALRAGYPGPFHAEGSAFATWMDACNALGYQIMAAVQAGTHPMPTEESLIAEMPPMVWPE